MTETKAIENKKPPTALESFRNTMNQMASQFKAALPQHITAEKFIRTVMTSIQQNPDVLNCNRQSLLSACVKSASDGLLPDGREAAIVKFAGDAVYMPMVAGLCKKARNSGDVSTLMAMEVYQNDKFRYWVDSDGEHIEHEPLLFGDRGDLKGFYALAKLKDGSILIEPMSKVDVDKIRAGSKGKDSSPWRNHYSEMGKKTVLRRMSKYRLPSSTDLVDSMRSDDSLFNQEETVDNTPQESGTVAPIADVTPKKRNNRLKDAINVKAEPVPAPEPEAEEEPVDRPAIFEGEATDLDKALENPV